MTEDICIQEFIGLALRERGTKVDCVVQCRKADGTEVNLCGPSEVFNLIGGVVRTAIQEKHQLTEEEQKVLQDWIGEAKKVVDESVRRETIRMWKRK